MKHFNFIIVFFALLFAVFTTVNAQPASIPYSCNFENTTENAKWVIPTSSTTNKWFIGTATQNGGTYSAYVTSNTTGTVAGYNNVNNTLPIYREFNTVNGQIYRITFDCKVNGQSGNDDFSVHWVNSTSVNISSWFTTSSTVPSTTYMMGNMQGLTTWQKCSFTAKGNGSAAKLVFLWRNNNSTANTPGACIDNVKIEIINAGSILINNSAPQKDYKPEDLIKKVFIKGGDCSVSNVTLSGNGWTQTTNPITSVWTSSTNRSLAYFSNGTLDGIGMTDGLILATGNALEAKGPNGTNTMDGGTSNTTDPDLKGLVPSYNLKTATILEFDFVPNTTTISFDYVFASREYPNFTCSNYNDVFGFFISGPGITGKKNIALLPDNTTAVAIANVNIGYTSSSCYAKNPQYYIFAKDNPYTNYNGHTRMLTTSTQTVTPGSTYRLKLAIANVGDDALGSGVFLRAGSLDLGLGVINNGNMINGMDNVFEGCGTNQFVINIAPSSTPVYITLTYSGTALGDIVSPDGTPLPTTIVIPPYSSQVVIPYKVNSPVTINGGTFIITADFTYCQGEEGFKHTFYVYEKIKNPIFTVSTPCGATSGTVKLAPLTEGTPYVKVSYDNTNVWDYAHNGDTINLPIGTHMVLFKDSVGCNLDTFYVNVPENPIPTKTISKEICQGTSYNFYGTMISSPGTYTHNVPMSTCDSVITLNLSVKNKVYGTDTKVACDSYTWINGTTYTSSNNTATHTLTSVAGCDSIVTLNLTINNTKYGTDTKVACDSYTWINGTTYTASTNTPTHTITGGAKNGCDSIVTLNLTIKNTKYSTDTHVACNSYTWINGTTYTSSNNTATYTVPGGASNGCDSIVILNLTINNTKYSIDTHVACNSYTWINGVTYTLSNNTDTHTFPGGSAADCDSVITLNLTVNHTAYGIDTKNACDSYTWINGVTYTESNNTDTHTIYGGSSKGCDSIVTLNLKMSYSVSKTIDAIICDDEVYIFNGQPYSKSGTYTAYLKTINGCDSIVTLNLEMIDNRVSIQVSDPICSNDGSFSFILSQSSGAVMPTDYKIDFIEKAVPSGFSNFVNQQGTITSNVIVVQMPENVYPDKYFCILTLNNNANDCKEISYEIPYDVLYPTSIMEQKWNNVIALLSEYYNGGFKFAGYQWYHNNQLLPGETQSYLYFQYSSFVDGDHYSVQITREDGSKVFSCPFETHKAKEQLNEFPTIVNGGEVIKISLQDKNTTVRLITVTGIVLSTANSSGEIVAPIQQGIYLLEILSGNNSVDIVKIVVK